MIVEQEDAALDGGSIFLRTRDREGLVHEVELVQSMFPQPRDSSRLRGRLYLDGQLVAVRSEREASLLAGLKRALEEPEGLPSRGAFVRELVQFVESEPYQALTDRDIQT